jgi:ABC-type Fe3+/spermidine/putrescine transport system ATPase subunit
MTTRTAVAERITVIDPAVATSACAVSLRRVTKSYGERTAVRELNLDIASGEFFSLLGPSGCGKTTTLRMVGGFVDPSYGEVSLHGKDVTDLPPNRRDVNTVFQSYALFDHLSVWENVAFGLRRRRVGKTETTRRVGEMLELVQLTGRDKDKPSALSGGQRQRVALARALVNRPSVLLLDESLAALDLKLRKAMQVELKRIQREVGITFVFVTHDQDEALTLADRTIVFSEGRVAQAGSPQEVYERPTSSFVAGFVGTSNVLAGEAAESVLGRDGSWSIRPEKISVAGADTPPVPDRTTAAGVVEELVYTGATTRCVVALEAGGVLSALLLNGGADGQPLSRGQAVRLSWKPEHEIRLM